MGGKRAITKKNNQEKFIKLYIKHNGSIKKTCEVLKMSRQTFYNWEKEEDFKELMKNAETHQMEDKRDEGESLLWDVARDGNVQAILHINKTLNRKRGYGDNIDITSDSEPIRIIFNDIVEKKNKDK